MSTAESYPRQYARTQRFSLGEPRSFTVSPDGHRIVFLRSRSGDDSVNCLWEMDLATHTERVVIDPRRLADETAAGELTPAERAQRERLREAGSGITSYSVDDAVRTVTFSHAGRLFIADVASGACSAIDTPAFDPRLDPTGTRLAYVVDAQVHVVNVAEPSTAARVLAGRHVFGEPDTVSWGMADFIAAEEMGRQRGMWWNSTGRFLAVARVDEEPVLIWHIADPSQPDKVPTAVRYPAAGTTNARVSISVFDVDSGERRDLRWAMNDIEYVADVEWCANDDVLVTLQSRDQRTVVITSATWSDPECRARMTLTSDTWVDLVPGAPTALSDGSIVTVRDVGGSKRLVVDETIVSDASITVHHIVSTTADTIVFVANDLDHPHRSDVWMWRRGSEASRRLTSTTGVHSAGVGGGLVVERRASVSLQRPTFTVRSLDAPETPIAEIPNLCEIPVIEPNVVFTRVGPRRIPTALLLPRTLPASGKLPVLMDPYAGPHAQRVVDSYAAHCTSQWFADQGFAVVVADGRGTPACGTEWERAVNEDLASVVLEDQIEALESLARDHPVLDTSRVAIRGWSFGGYLAGLAVLRRPDVFHAGIAGAPVTDWRLYDTHYTERYLGNPRVDDTPYERTSLIALADRLSRPLLLIHGLADDNVVAAHTLQLSAALLAAGKPHEVLPLSGVTHMTPQAAVAENLLLHQLDFLRRSLGPT